MVQLTDLAKALVNLEKDRVNAIVEDKLKRGIPPLEIVKELNDGMIEVGERFASGEYFISELIYSSHIMKEAMVQLEPLFEHVDLGELGGKVVIGTVKGDIHDIGKNIVVTLLRNAGFKVIDLGVDVGTERFVEILQETKAKVLGLSCLLNLAFQEMKNVVDMLKKAGIRDQVKVIIGGTPTDEQVREYVGADYYAPDAVAGIKICKEIYAQ
ncbi:MAG: corrinoid protein [Thermodesulfobacteriota bacterium]|jgi:methylmalonyl-CoA mutase cobalamin-binding domain/chain